MARQYSVIIGPRPVAGGLGTSSLGLAPLGGSAGASIQAAAATRDLIESTPDFIDNAVH